LLKNLRAKVNSSKTFSFPDIKTTLTFFSDINKSRHLLCGWEKLENCKKCGINSLYCFYMKMLDCLIKVSRLLFPVHCVCELCGSLIKLACSMRIYVVYANALSSAQARW
jgi:hypothetical protein